MIDHICSVMDIDSYISSVNNQITFMKNLEKITWLFKEESKIMAQIALAPDAKTILTQLERLNWVTGTKINIYTPAG